MKVVEVQFRKVGKKYFFGPNNLDLQINSLVVVETIRGLELGTVVSNIKDVDESKIIGDLKPVLRIASLKDIKDYEVNKELEKKVLERCFFYVKKHKLEMKLLASEYTLDKSRLIIYFESEGRVDFRLLVKDLADEFKVRIELRQVGSRDGAKFIGGLGPCGLIMCCVTHIGEFDNVSIKMAKNQNLSLNPQKISGTCGKLLCCINFENDLYTELKKNLPDVGDFVITEKGKGKVMTSDCLNEVFKVKFDEDTICFISKSEIIEIQRRKKQKENIDDLKELRGLEN